MRRLLPSLVALLVIAVCSCKKNDTKEDPKPVSDFRDMYRVEVPVTCRYVYQSDGSGSGAADTVDYMYKDTLRISYTLSDSVEGQYGSAVFRVLPSLRVTSRSGQVSDWGIEPVAEDDFGKRKLYALQGADRNAGGFVRYDSLSLSYGHQGAGYVQRTYINGKPFPRPVTTQSTAKVDGD